MACRQCLVIRQAHINRASTWICGQNAAFMPGRCGPTKCVHGSNGGLIQQPAVHGAASHPVSQRAQWLRPVRASVARVQRTPDSTWRASEQSACADWIQRRTHDLQRRTRFFIRKQGWARALERSRIGVLSCRSIFQPIYICISFFGIYNIF